MKGAIDAIDLGPRAQEVKEILRNYFSAFGKSTINNTDEKAFPQLCPHLQMQSQEENTKD